MNLHHLAVKIARREGKKKQMNIAQIKEVLHCLIAVEVDLMSTDIEPLPSEMIQMRALTIFEKNGGRSYAIQWNEEKKKKGGR